MDQARFDKALSSIEDTYGEEIRDDLKELFNASNAETPGPSYEVLNAEQVYNADRQAQPVIGSLTPSEGQKLRHAISQREDQVLDAIFVGGSAGKAKLKKLGVDLRGRELGPGRES